MFKVVKEECEDFFFRLCKEEDICDDEQKPNKQEQSDQEEEKSSRRSKNKTQKLQWDWNDDMDQDAFDENEQEDKKTHFGPFAVSGTRKGIPKPQKTSLHD